MDRPLLGINRFNRAIEKKWRGESVREIERDFQPCRASKRASKENKKGLYGNVCRIDKRFDFCVTRFVNYFRVITGTNDERVWKGVSQTWQSFRSWNYRNYRPGYDFYIWILTMMTTTTTTTTTMGTTPPHPRRGLWKRYPYRAQWYPPSRSLVHETVKHRQCKPIKGWIHKGCITGPW